MKSAFLTTLGLLCVFSSFSQQEFRRGYILPPAADTIFGFIRPEPEDRLSLSVFFSKDSSTNGKEYAPTELSGFSIGGLLYRSLRFVDDRADTPVNRIRFCRLREDGPSQLLVLLDGGQYFFIAQRDTARYFMYDWQYQTLGDVRKRGNFQNILSFLAVDCTDANLHPDRITYNEKAIAAFFHALNNCLSPKTATSYFQKQKLEKTLILFAGGLPLPHASQFTSSANLAFVNPSFSRKLSLNIGLYFSNTVSSNSYQYYGEHRAYTHRRVISVPLTFRYHFFEGRIQPYAYAGMGLSNLKSSSQSDQGTGVSFIFGLGVDVRVLQQLYLTADYRYELFFHYPAVGLSYRVHWKQ